MVNDTIKPENNLSKIDQDGNIKKLGSDFSKKKISGKKQEISLWYLNVGFYILTPLLGGVFLGLVLDNFFKSKPLFTGILLFLGTVACFYNLVRLLRNGK